MKKNQIRILAACILSGLGIMTLSSFDGESGGGGEQGIFQEATPEVDCSTNVIVYGYTSTSGSGSGSLGYSGGGSSGNASGAGSSSTTSYGPIGMMYTPKKQMDCKITWWGSCNSVACHATGPGVFTPFPKK